MEADTDLLKITLFGKTGGFGVKLKRLTDDLSPKQSFGAGLSCLRQGMGLDLEYRSDTYEVPVYGGNSQKRTISYQVGASWRKNKLRVSNTTSFDLDRGKVQSTDYLLSVEEFGAKLEASFTLNRPLGQTLLPLSRALLAILSSPSSPSPVMCPTLVMFITCLTL